MINPPPPPKPPTPHKEMLAATFLPGQEAVERVAQQQPSAAVSEAQPKLEELHSDDQKHRDKCSICQSKVGNVIPYNVNFKNLTLTRSHVFLCRNCSSLR